MKFATSRLADKSVDESDRSDTVWLPRARVGAKRPGDLLVVVLSAGLILTLGLVVVVARLEPHTADPASRVAAVQQPVMRASPAAQAAPPPVAIASPPQAVATPSVTTPSAVAPPAAAPVVTPVAPRPVTPVTTASVPTPQAAAPSSPAGLAPLAAPVVQPPLAQPVEVSRQTPPRAGARFDPALAFAAPTFPTGALPPEMAQAPDVAADLVVEPPQQTARLAPAEEPEAEPEAAPPARQTNAQSGAQPGAKAGEPVAKKGAAGATWAVYFDQFPDQSAAAARINAMQSKYGPYLGGRSLTYTRTGGDWRLRVTGLTEDAARGICDKVKSAGSNCAVGGR